MNRNIKTILSVAGSDSIGGAGVQADIKTISALGHYAMTAVTAVTAQNTMGVRLSEAVFPKMMRGQLDAVFDDITPDSVKIGMLANSENAEIIADRLKFYNAKNIVCDTVIMSTSGKELLTAEGLKALINKLFPIAAIITPNISEAERLCGMHIGSISDMERAAEILSETTPGAVLIKGGHLPEEAADVLRVKDKLYTFTSPRLSNPNTHGTGCTLSSAIACGLAEGLQIPEAVKRAKDYITRIIGNSFDIGKGCGSMWHFD